MNHLAVKLCVLAGALVGLLGFAAGEFDDANKVIEGIFPGIRATASWEGTLATASSETRSTYGAPLRQAFQFVARFGKETGSLIFSDKRFDQRRIHFVFTDDRKVVLSLPGFDRSFGTMPDRGLTTNNYSFGRPGIPEMNLISAVWMNRTFYYADGNAVPFGFVMTSQALAGALTGYQEVHLRQPVELFMMDQRGTYLEGATEFAMQQEYGFLEWLKTQPAFLASAEQTENIRKRQELLRGIPNEQGSQGLIVNQTYAPEKGCGDSLSSDN